MPILPPRVADLPGSGIRAIMEQAWRTGGGVIGLHVGEPRFPTPPHILDAITVAQEHGKTGYAPSAGLPDLRDAIVAKLARDNDLALGPDRVVVSVGGTQALHLALSTVLCPGDHVLLPDPGWPNAASIVRILAARPLGYPLRAANGFWPDVDELATLITPRTRAIVVNSPANPVGTVLDAALLDRLVGFAHDHDLWLVSDECYEAITFDRPHVSPARLDPDGRVLSCFSFSKTHAMTGLRVGYLTVPTALAAVVPRVQEAMLACVSTPAQYGALAALTGPQEHVAAAREAYRDRRDAATAILTAAACAHVSAAGTFFVWAQAPSSDTTAWAAWLLRERLVAVAPGRAFGPHGEGWVRLSLVAPTADLRTGLRRMITG